MSPGPATQPLLDGTVLAEQIELEMTAIRGGVERYRRQAEQAVRRGEGASLKPAERLILHWLPVLQEAITQEQRSVRKGEYGVGRHAYGPPLLLLTPDRLALITLQEMLGTCMAEPGGVLRQKLAYSLGRAVLAEANLTELHERDREVYKRLTTRVRRLTPRKVNYWAKRSLDDAVTDRTTAAHLGVVLVWAAIGACSAADHDQPFALAFHHRRVRAKGVKTAALIRMDDRVYRILEEGHLARQYLRPRYLPMVVAPCPWVEGVSEDGTAHAYQGGFVRIRTPFIINPTPDQKAALRTAKLGRVYEAVNAIGSTPWRVNRRLLGVARKMWDEGGAGELLPSRDDRALPDRPANMDDPEVKKAWKKEAVRAHRHNARLRGARLELLQVLGVAESFAERPRFWLPHKCDYRGRTYPVPLYLHHQGDDLCRGLLELGDARPVEWNGPQGNWVHIHAANSYGMDKAPYHDRIHWSLDHQKQILRAARDPLNDDWWRGAEKPWQFLAACMAVLHDDAAAHIGVQMDGTCNGLQHLAAMGRDEPTARLVNLVAGDAPNDAYGVVARASVRRVEGDAAAGNPVARGLLAHLRDPKKARTCCKRHTMTKFYGVTDYGARNQARENLGEFGMEGPELWDASAYLAGVVEAAIGETCHGASAIMDWLQGGAALIARAGRLVTWTSPLGLPVVQPYRRWRKLTLNTLLGRMRLRVEESSVPVDVAAHVAGASPNFTHTIDAAHWMRVAVRCRHHEDHLAAAAVHDGFWTHAATASRQGVVLREEFVALHEGNPLEALRDEWAAAHPDLSFPPLPPRGTLDLGEILTSPYAFS